MINTFQSLVGQLALPSMARQEQENMCTHLQLVERAFVIGAIACAAIFIMAPTFLALLGLGAIAYGSYEASIVTRNFKQIVATHGHPLNVTNFDNREDLAARLGFEAPLAAYLFKQRLPNIQFRRA